ncbi:hypothetical protein ABBQ32_005852 [Trebouxia sp. C0010 RCD-2024]
MQNLGPRPPYHPGMQQSAWQNQQPQLGFQQTFYAGPHGFPQQYALVPLNGGTGLPHPHAMPLAGPPPGRPSGLGSSHVMNGPGMNAFSHGCSGPSSMGPTFGGPPAGGRGSGPRPPPGQPSWESSGSVGRGRGRSGFEARGGARGRGRGRGTGPSPGRAGRGLPPPVAGARGAPPPAMGFRGPPPMSPPPSGMTKDQRKNAKAMAKLDKVVQAEGPRVYKALSEAERLEAARWQAERRKHYPTAVNVAQKADAAASRDARGELEPEQALRRKRLQEVLVRQRELGLAQIAGTSDMPIDGQLPLANAGFVLGGRTGRGSRGGGRAGGRAGRSPGRAFGRGPGRGFGRGPDGAVSNGPGRVQPGTKRGLEFGQGQQADKRQKSAHGEAVPDGQLGGLASLMQYGSDEEGQNSEGPNGNEGTDGGQREGGQPPPAAPQTAEEKQALFLKQRAQYERQQQQHQASMERRKKAQEKWESKGRGRGRGRGATGRGRGGRHPDRSEATKQAKRAPTLLQKLLVKDIRKDHSHLLQCFRFLVNNNFLQDVGSKPLVYPDPPPTLREVLPPMPDGDDSQGSERDDEDVEDGNALLPALNGGMGSLGSHPQAQSSSDALLPALNGGMGSLGSHPQAQSSSDADSEEEEEDDSEEEEEAAGSSGQQAQAVGEQQEQKENSS